MGSHEAELAELVGFFLLHQISEITPKEFADYIQMAS